MGEMGEENGLEVEGALLRAALEAKIGRCMAGLSWSSCFVEESGVTDLA
jgi:hypothetical protein